MVAKRLHCDKSLDTAAPARRVNNNAHQTSSNDASDGQGDDPAAVDPGDHAPVDGAPSAGAEADANGRAGDALGGGDGELCWEIC